MGDEEHKCFDLEHGMRIFDSNKEMLEEILISFIEKIPEDLQAIEKALSEESAEEVERYSHRMKGAASMVGAMRFMDQAHKLELISKDGVLDDANLMIQNLKKEFSLLKSELEKFEWEKV
jgi:HPt (histidine-containing phosphotransfer) domain-containing protein